MIFIVDVTCDENMYYELKLNLLSNNLMTSVLFKVTSKKSSIGHFHLLYRKDGHTIVSSKNTNLLCNNTRPMICILPSKHCIRALIYKNKPFVFNKFLDDLKSILSSVGTSMVLKRFKEVFNWYEFHS